MLLPLKPLTPLPELSKATGNRGQAWPQIWYYWNHRSHLYHWWNYQRTLDFIAISSCWKCHQKWRLRLSSRLQSPTGASHQSSLTRSYLAKESRNWSLQKSSFLVYRVKYRRSGMDLRATKRQPSTPLWLLSIYLSLSSIFNFLITIGYLEESQLGIRN